jgi:hypothetical protein
MRPINLTRAVAIFSILAWFGTAPSKGLADNLPIDENMLESQVVAVGRLTAFVEAPDAQEEFRNAHQMVGGLTVRQPAGGPEIVPPKILSTPGRRLKGTYTFAAQLRLKGQCPDVLSLQLPGLEWMQYGDPKLEIRDQSSFVLFLNREGDRWTATDGRWPLIPLGKDADIPKAPFEGSEAEATALVVRLMVAGLDDPIVRGATLKILSKTRSADVATAARKYWDDPDYYVKQAALCCLATNEVVEAIPRIVEMYRGAAARGGNLGLGADLQAYHTPEAVPYLNAAMVDSDQALRINAAMALRQNRLADKSSIPFLLSAVRNRDLSSSQAMAMLHDVIPGLGPWAGGRSSAQQREDAIKAAEAWWADELAGKHGDIAPATSPSSVR